MLAVATGGQLQVDAGMETDLQQVGAARATLGEPRLPGKAMVSVH